ncbi:MAG TPA: YciI family protein [Thermoanaerobaculia bacterium]|jgi:hypothetical protein
MNAGNGGGDGERDERDERDELSHEERRALRDLWGTGSPEPPEALEAATLNRLGQEGLIAARRGARPPRLLAAAAGLLLFGLGLAAGARLRPQERAGEASALPRFVLLLYDAPDEKTLTDAQMAARVSEYRDWARGVRGGGRDIAGEKLETGGTILGPSGVVSGWPLGGYFVISARDLDAAVAVARTCPHVRHGGRVEVRPIART